MENSDRARQFMPFDALKGLQDALREKEREVEERIELSEESMIELNSKFQRLDEGNTVLIRHYKNRQYVNSYGKITNIDAIRRKLCLNESEYINIFDIINIEINPVGPMTHRSIK